MRVGVPLTEHVDRLLWRLGHVLSGAIVVLACVAFAVRLYT